MVRRESWLLARGLGDGARDRERDVTLQELADVSGEADVADVGAERNHKRGRRRGAGAIDLEVGQGLVVVLALEAGADAVRRARRIPADLQGDGAAVLERRELLAEAARRIEV